jgi:hypothetical protein
MSTPSITPNLAEDLIRTHKVITRGLETSLKFGADFAQQGFPDLRTQQGYADYVHSLQSTLDGHHLAEDEVAFPAVKLKLPDAPYERLAADHQQIVVILGEVKQAIPGLVSDNPRPALATVLDALTRITAIWSPHIEKEEFYFAEKPLSAVMSLEEQGRLSAATARYSQEHTGPDYLVVPFFLFNLAGQDRAAIAQVLPPVITQQLIPIVWKDKWAPMKPFLLE